MIDFEKSEKLYEYHLKAIKLFNPLREGQVRDKYKDEKFLQSLSAGDRKKVEEYGYPHVLENFHSHVTFARLYDTLMHKKVMDNFAKQFEGRKTDIVRLQIHQALFKPVNKNILLVDEKLEV